jgi:hypothetical protein
MFVVTEADAAAIRAAFDRGGELYILVGWPDETRFTSVKIGFAWPIS